MDGSPSAKPPPLLPTESAPMPARPSAIALIAGIFAAVLAPRAPVLPAAWAAANMILPDGPNAGEHMDLTRTPYVVEPMNFWADDTPGNKGVWRKSKQVGASTTAIACMGFTVDQEPCDVSLIEPTDTSLAEFLSLKWQRAVDASPKLKASVWNQKSRANTGSTTYVKRFAGGSILCGIATSTADLRGKTRKKVIRDEAAEYPDDLEGQGSPHDMITGSYEAFRAGGDWKDLWISTPTLKGDAIDAEFEAGDRRYWHVVCPGCGEKFVFTDDLRYFKFNTTFPYNAHYVAPCCGTVIEGHQKNAMVQDAVAQGGGWVATMPGPGRHISWHFDAMSSPFVPWDLVAERLCAINGDAAKQKTYDNLTMGRGYEIKGDAPDWQRLMALREPYDRRRIPPQGLILVACADVQANAIYVEVVAYGRDRHSWVVEAIVLDGDTSDPEAGAFAKLSEVYDMEWPDSFGGKRRVDAFGVDSGYRSNTVYLWVRGRPDAFALKGGEGWTRPALGTPSPMEIDIRGKKIKKGANLWMVGTWSLKAVFYADLRKRRLAEGAEIEPAGTCHFGDWLDETYFQQLTAECLVEEKLAKGKMLRGRARRIWFRTAANHFLDCRIYNMALADYIGLGRWTADEWAQLAKVRGVPAELKAWGTDLLAPDPVRIAAAPREHAAAGSAAVDWPPPSALPLPLEGARPRAPTVPAATGRRRSSKQSSFM